MATSRRRERELARRRYERRRQAEIERRAAAKRRNTIIGAVSGTGVVIAVLLILTFTVFTGGGSGKKSAVKPGTTPTTSPSATASTSASPTAAPPAPTKCAPINPNPPAKGEPFVPPVKGKPSSKLVTKDIKVGHGPAAKSGDKVTVKYVGVSCDTGEVFDASYTDGAPHQQLGPFPLGAHQVISGWDEGLVGMKVGGVRELIIPASKAYGESGSGKIQGNDTLIFVVTLDKLS